MHSISSLVTTARSEQIGTCRVQFPCEWGLYVGFHAWETLKKNMNGHLRYFPYITRMLFFQNLHQYTYKQIYSMLFIQFYVW